MRCIVAAELEQCVAGRYKPRHPRLVFALSKPSEQFGAQEARTTPSLTLSTASKRRALFAAVKRAPRLADWYRQVGFPQRLVGHCCGVRTQPSEIRCCRLGCCGGKSVCRGQEKSTLRKPEAQIVIPVRMGG